MDTIGLPGSFENGGRPRQTLGGQRRDQLPRRLPSTNPPRHASMPPQFSPPGSFRSANTSTMKASPIGHMRPVAEVNPKVLPFEDVVNPQVSRLLEDPVPGAVMDDGLLIGSPSQPQVIEPQPQAIIDSPAHPMPGPMDNTRRIIEFLGKQLPPLPSTPSSKISRLAPEPRQSPSREMPAPPRPGLTRDQSFPPVCASLPDDLKHIVEDDNSFTGNDAAGDRGHSGGNPANMGRGNAHRDEPDDFSFFDIPGVDSVDRGSTSSSSSSRSRKNSAVEAPTPEVQGSPTLQDIRTQPRRDDFKKLEAMIPGFQTGTPPNETNDGERKTKSSLSPPPPTSSSSGVNDPMATSTRKGSLSQGVSNNKRKHQGNDPSRGRYRGGRGGGARNGFMRGYDGETAVNGNIARASMMDRELAGVAPEPLFPEDLFLPFSEDPSLDLLQERFADPSTSDGFFFPST